MLTLAGAPERQDSERIALIHRDERWSWGDLDRRSRADRRADLIISGGVNVWPAEVEAALLPHPAFRSCAVVGLADEDLGQRVHAIVESDDAALDIDSLRLFLADRLSREKYRRSLNIQPTPVRDDAGKVRKPASIAERTPQ